jgi:hypothetical protein
VGLADVLPGDGWTINPANPDCSIAANGAGSDELECDFGTLDAPAEEGDGDTASVTVQRTAAGGDCGTVSNTAFVSAENEDPAASLDNNTDSASIAVNCGSITIAKEASDGGEWPTGFAFDDDIPSCSIGVLGVGNSRTCEDIGNGTFVITETPAGSWELDDISCSGSGDWEIDEGDASVTITLTGTQSVSCTFVNDPPNTVPPTTTIPQTVTTPVVTQVQGVQATPPVSQVLPARLPSTGAVPVADGFAWLMVIGLGAIGLGSAVMLVTRTRRNER